MALFHVLAPETFRLEKLGALGHLAPILGLVFLLDITRQFIIKRLLQRLPTQLLEIDVLGFQDLHQLVLKRLDPAKSPL